MLFNRCGTNVHIELSLLKLSWSTISSFRSTITSSSPCINALFPSSVTGSTAALNLSHLFPGQLVAATALTSLPVLLFKNTFLQSSLQRQPQLLLDHGLVVPRELWKVTLHP